jgi:hypothetical protein
LKEFGVTEKPLDTDSILGQEVGDDRIDISLDPISLAVLLHVQEKIFKMQTSLEDTFLSDTYWNFCESTGVIPSSRDSSFTRARKSGNFSFMEFPDYPPIRIVIDARKASGDHSSTVVGKAAMLSSRTGPTNGDSYATMALANWLQDAALRTEASSEPKYMPSVLGGSGGTAPFSNVGNLSDNVSQDRESWNHYLALQGYKSGTYSRVYGTAVAECMNAIEHYERTQEPATPILAGKLRWKKEYLHGTYHNQVFIPRTNLSTVDKDPPVPVYRAVGGANLLVGVERRLEASRRLVSKKNAEVELARSRKLEVYLKTWKGVKEEESIDKRKFADLAKAFGGALTANAAFRALLEKDANVSTAGLLSPEEFQIVSDGVVEYNLGYSQWLVGKKGKGEVLSIHDLHSSEDMYILSEVSTETSLKVPGISLRPIGSKQRFQTTVAQLGLWQVSSTQEEWADNIVDRLTAARDYYKGPVPRHQVLDIFYEDREWVSDDTLIIQRASSDVSRYGRGNLILVSRDHRLGSQLAATTNCHVLVVDPMGLIRLGLKESYDSSTSFEVDEIMAVIPPRMELPPGETLYVYVDTGSFESVATQVDNSPTGTRSLYVSGGPLHRFRNYDRGTIRRYIGLRTSERLIPREVRVHYPRGKTARPWVRGSSFVAPRYEDPGRHYSND